MKPPVSERCVARHISQAKKAGHDFKQSRNLQSVVTKLKVEHAVELYKTGLTMQEVGEQMEPPMPKHNVKYYIKLAKLYGHEIEKRRCETTNLEKPVLEKMVELYKKGLSLREIGEQMEPPITGNRVAYYLYKTKEYIYKNRKQQNETRKLKIEQIVKLYKQGLTMREVGERMEPPMTESSVAYYLNQNTFIHESRERRSKATRMKIAQVAELHMSGLTMREVGERMKPPMTEHCVGYYLSRAKKNGDNIGQWQSEATKLRLGQVVELYNSGLTIQKVGERMEPQLGRSGVSKLLRKARECGYEIRKQQSESRKLKAEQIVELFNQGLTKREIGKRMEPPLSSGGVARYLRRVKECVQEIKKRRSEMVKQKNEARKLKTAQVVELYQQGLTKREISERMKPPMSLGSVRYHLRQANVGCQSRKQISESRKLKTAQIIELYTQGLTKRAIGERMKPPMTEHGVKYHFRLAKAYVHEIEKRRSEILKQQIELKQFEMKQVLELYKQGMNTREIGLQVGVPHWTVSDYLRILRKEGHEVPTKIEIRQCHEARVIQMVNMYKQDDMTSEEIAKTRIMQILEMRKQGIILETIGKALDPPITRERVRQILKKHNKNAKE
jgi:DNA-binding transcriptional regulator WhiA/DNA-binding CsgD family transcriptional regulator